MLTQTITAAHNMYKQSSSTSSKGNKIRRYTRHQPGNTSIVVSPSDSGSVIAINDYHSGHCAAQYTAYLSLATTAIAIATAMASHITTV
eukprot:2262-Heterococcus_DN1.PRE.4